ncbi:MAG: response regulator [Pseudobdellovibrionaceae bacterium]|nr:response regulator [Bdellovibrionales bacterium]USN47147.1 MAG: response regulator [Pseudobdellovibrionaceae bacterium]
MKKSEINILVVDDDSSILEALVQAVTRSGFTALPASNGKEAIQIAKLKPVHSAIVDCMLPGTPGVDLVRQLKNTLPNQDSCLFILMSGIFRDRSFPAEAMGKTGAKEFFLKPFDNREILKVLEQELAHHVDVPKVDLHSLLSQPFASQRERRKALDHVEDMYGYDLPFMLCILMDAGSSGHLNIVNENHEIYGITVAEGQIAKVDTEKSKDRLQELLEKKGFVSAKEISELEVQNKKGDLIKNLIHEGLLSPHAMTEVLPEQILMELRHLVTASKVQVNFSPDRKLKGQGGCIDLVAFTSELERMIEKQIPVDWLVDFYSAWMDHPIVLGPNYDDHSSVLKMHLVRSAGAEFIECVRGGCTLKEINDRFDATKMQSIYRGLHLLALRRLVVFAESKKSSDFTEKNSRIEEFLKQFKTKNAVQIFQFLGASDRMTADEVSRIYKEIAKEYHPDRLPVSAPEALKKKAHDLFAIISSAQDVLVHQDKRAKFFEELKQEEAKKQMLSEDLLGHAKNNLVLGKYKEAQEQLEEAENLFSSSANQMHLIWVKLKRATGEVPLEVLAEMQEQLRRTDPDLKTKATFHFVSGLVHLAMRDVATAAKDFQKANQIDNRFMPARRELASLKSVSGKKVSTKDLLTGDLSSVVGSFFKKKR